MALAIFLMSLTGSLLSLAILVLQYLKDEVIVATV